MRRLASWLDIFFDATLLQSTWNSRPYVVEVRGVRICGSHPENARRRSKNLSTLDQLLVFALLRENFYQWRYPIPSKIRWPFTRFAVVLVCILIPLRMEMENARAAFRLQMVPAWRTGRYKFACLAPMWLIFRRLRLLVLILGQYAIRARGQIHPLRVL
jgi:hypothetical protein